MREWDGPVVSHRFQHHDVHNSYHLNCCSEKLDYKECIDPLLGTNLSCLNFGKNSKSSVAKEAAKSNKKMDNGCYGTNFGEYFDLYHYSSQICIFVNYLCMNLWKITSKYSIRPQENTDFKPKKRNKEVILTECAALMEGGKHIKLNVDCNNNYVI